MDKLISDEVARGRRLIDYLAPRRNYLDDAALSSAEFQGALDFEATGRAFQACSKTCKLGGPDTSKQVSCAKQCMQDAPTPNPTVRCKSVDWLPY